jgi:peptidoglycan/xylan/chitin deacetylase (PgdA/CDA1 family)
MRRAVVLILAAIGLSACGSSSPQTVSTHARPKPRVSATGGVHTTVTGAATGRPGTTPVPVLMYHVINPPPAGAPFPGLYVPGPEFAAQMQALKAGGWHAVTLDQLKAYWTRGVPLPPGKPIVLTFDNGYQSQYSNALPVLKRMGWVGNEMMQLSGLPPAQGGLSGAQVRALVSAGWEIDTQGMSHADLIAIPASELHYQVFTARQLLRRRFGVTADWFAYPSGHYNPNVITALKAAGFVGSLTVVPGWASPTDDPFRLPRLRVLGGTSPSALLAQIASNQGAAPPPLSYP